MAREPRPRDMPAVYEPLVWPESQRIQLASCLQPAQVDLARVLECRESRRDFSQGLSDATLGEFLWLACRNRSSRPSPFGFEQESRVHPSAGGMHPIHTLIGWAGGNWMRYDPLAHALAEVPGSQGTVTTSRAAASEVVPVGQGVLLALVAEPGRTAAKYENHETLVWRDAGVVLGYMSIAAEALRMSFCPLGMTGQSCVLQGWANGDALWAVGLALLGGPADNSSK